MTEADVLRAIVDRCHDVIKEVESGTEDLSRKVGGLQCMLRAATTLGLIDVEKVQQAVLDYALRGSIAHSRHGHLEFWPGQLAKAVGM